MAGDTHSAETTPAHNPGLKGGRDADCWRKPRSSSFRDSDKYVRSKSGTFVRQGSGELYGTTMPDFKNGIIAVRNKKASTYIM